MTREIAKVIRDALKEKFGPRIGTVGLSEGDMKELEISVINELMSLLNEQK